jgi:hypothetical protein
MEVVRGEPLPEQTVEEKLLSIGVRYSLGVVDFHESLEKIKNLLDEHDENCHCCRMPYCECDEE